MTAVSTPSCSSGSGARRARRLPRAPRPYGEGRLVVISGEAGVGKTALARELCASHRGSAQVLWAQCDPLQTPRALGPVLDIARRCRRRPREPRRHRRPPSPVRRAHHVVDQRRLAGDRRHRRPAVGRRGDARLRHVRRSPSGPHAMRAGRDATGTRSVATIRCGACSAISRPPRRFGVSDSLRSARARSPSSRRRRSGTLGELHRLSAGVPFVVGELLTAEPGALTSVHESVLARAARLDAEAREVLDAASLLSDGAPVSVLRHALAESEPGIEACVEAGLLVHDGRTLSFRHELARQVDRHRDHADAASAVCITRSSAGLLDAGGRRRRGVRPPRRARRRSGGRAGVRAPGRPARQRFWARTARRSPSTSGRCGSPEASHRRTGLRCSTSTRPSCSS